MIDIDHDALRDICAACSPRWPTERSGATAHTTNINHTSADLRLALGEPATIAGVEWFKQRRVRCDIGGIAPAEFERDFYARTCTEHEAQQPVGIRLSDTDLAQKADRFIV